MRFFAGIIIVLLTCCAPPGFRYAPGDFLTLTPNEPLGETASPQIVSAQQDDRPICGETAAVSCRMDQKSICGSAVGADCSILMGRFAQQYNLCTQYRGYAVNAFSAYQAHTMSETFAEDAIVRSAGGTERTREIVSSLVRAAYSGQYLTAQDFVDSAFQGCLRGKLL